MSTKSKVEDSHFKDPNKSVFERGQKPEHGQKLVHDIFAGHDAEKKAYKDQHKDAKDPRKLEENAEAAATKRELQKLNEQFKKHLPEGSQIVGHGKGKNGDYIFVKPSKDSKDVYAVNPDTGKPEAHYRITEGGQWAQVGKGKNNNESLTFKDKSKVEFDEHHRVAKIATSENKSIELTYGKDNKVQSYKSPDGTVLTRKEGNTWSSSKGGADWKGDITVDQKTGNVTEKYDSGHLHTIRRDGSQHWKNPDHSETDWDKGGKLQQVKYPDGKSVEIKYGPDNKPVSYKDQDGSQWSTTDNQNWRNDKTGEKYSGSLSNDSMGNVIWARSDGFTHTYNRDGSHHWKNSNDSETEFNSKGKLTHLKDATNQTVDLKYGSDGNANYYKDKSGHEWNSKDGHHWVAKDGKSNFDGKITNDANGNITVTRDDKSSTTYGNDGSVVERDSNNRLKQVVNSQRTENYEYEGDALSKISVAEPNGSKHVWEKKGNQWTIDNKAEPSVKDVRPNANGTVDLTLADGVSSKWYPDGHSEQFKNGQKTADSYPSYKVEYFPGGQRNIEFQDPHSQYPKTTDTLVSRNGSWEFKRQGVSHTVTNVVERSNGDITFTDPVTKKQVTVHQHRSPEAQ